MADKKEIEQIVSLMHTSRVFSIPKQIDATEQGGRFVLGYLSEARGEVLAGDLARKLSVSTARIAALIKRLEKKGLVTRHVSMEDRRCTVVEITEAGRQQALVWRQEMCDGIGRLIDTVGRDELMEFIRIGIRIKEAIAANRKEETV